MAQVKIIQGRPDMSNHSYGRTYAKKFPPYVFSTNFNGCLIHKVRKIEMVWYEVATRDSLRWLKNPRIIVITKCGQAFYQKARRGKVGFKTCQVPDRSSVICERCKGNGSTFKKGAISSADKKAAHAKLGCLVEVE